MVIKISIESVYEGKNKVSGRITFYDNLSRGGDFIFKSKFGDTFTIKIQGLEKIKEDNRPSFIELIHNVRKKPHKIQLVLDCTHNYRKSEEPHLNLTNPSIRSINSCKICKQYFEELNHKHIFNNNSTDSDMLWEQIKKYLNQKSFFNEYKLI